MVVGEGDGPLALELSPTPLTFFPTSHRSETSTLAIFKCPHLWHLVHLRCHTTVTTL